MIEVVIGTSNPSKLNEFRNIAASSNVKIFSLADIGVEAPEIEESGSSYEENAHIKYDALRPLIPDKYILITEDSGVSIDALNGEPGVHSRRWNDEGREMSDKELIEKMQSQLADKPDRTARFIVAAAFGGSGYRMKAVHGEIVGEMLKTPRVELATEGFPYRAFFFIPSLGIMLSELHNMPAKTRPGFRTHREQIWDQILETLE